MKLSGSTKYSLFILPFLLFGCYKNPNPVPIGPKKLTQIVTWGDSLTAGYGGEGTSYPSALQQLTGIKVINQGVSGDKSTQIAARMVDSTQYYSSPVIIWAGRNNFRDTTQIRADIATMVSKLKHKDYIILGVTNGQYDLELKGASDYVIINKLNASLAKIYGSHYIDIRAYLVSLYDPTNAQDVKDHNNDIPPSSLRYDDQHLNAAGYTDVARRINTSINILKQ